ncbi:MAG: DUF493 domain-containing protein [Victivallales bacterium]|nr:DUF493 domain-containing protein [Victivallales bacterium]MCF7888977.1 DUF493 domain-containing protein [Victivallales bacterium]
MKTINFTGRPEIDFPCEWSYKVFGTSRGSVETAIRESLAEKSYSVTKSVLSSKGNYISITVKLTVNDRNEIDSLYKALSQHKNIKIVL